MSNFITSWILDLVDNVTAPLQAMQGAADVTADAVDSVQEANKGVESSANAANEAIKKTTVTADIAKGVFTGMLQGLAGYFTIRGMVRFFNQSLSDFDTQAKSSAQLMATLESTNYAAGKSFEELADRASSLQEITLFGDEATMQAQAIMLTFKSVTNEIYDRSIPAVLDMATALKMDLKSSSLMLGKALNDPILGLTALRRTGIQFTDEQQNVIKKLVETGNVAQAQTIILAELESQFGGSAAAAAAAGTGMLTQIRNSWGDVREIIGQGFYSLVELIAPVVVVIINALGKMFQFVFDNSEVFKALATGAAIGAAAFVVFKVATFLLSGGFGVLATSAVAAAQTITAAIFSIPIIGWVAAIIAALVALGVYFWNTSAKFRGFLYGLWEAVKTVFSGIGGFISDTLKAIWDLIKNVFNPKNWFNSDYSLTDDLRKISDIAHQYGESIGKAFRDGQEKGINAFEADKAKKEAKKTAGKYPGVITAADLLSDSGNNGVIKATGGSESGSGDSQKGLSLSGSGGGGGRSITMNVTMTNNFSGSSENEVMKIVRQLTDRLSDAAVAI